ncbi:MAG: metallopeptidase TldD-related protein [Dehalococcoidia bacterium]
MEELLKIARKSVESAEVFHMVSCRTTAQFEANRLKQILTRDGIATALRIVKNGRVGFAQVSGNIKSEELLKMALETSPFGYQMDFLFPSFQSFPKVEVFDPRVERVAVKDMVSLGENIIRDVCANTPGILCEGSLSRGTATLTIDNSSGEHANCMRSSFSVSIDGMLIRDGDMLYVGDIRSSCRPIIDHTPVSGEIIRQLGLARKNASIGTGTFPVIFTPFGIAGALMAPLISAFNGKTVLDGASPLKDKIGKRLFDKRFSFYDDPTLDFQPGSTPFDDEGVPTRKNTFVNAGVVHQFYYDLHTAALAGTISTGNGNRNGGMPSPSPHALVIDPGNTPVDEMIKNIREGLIIEQLMGAEQGNILNGDFSGNVLLGYKVENGGIAGRVKDTMVYGNVYELLKDVTAIGNDSRWIAGYVNTPSICFPQISVASK